MYIFSIDSIKRLDLSNRIYTMSNINEKDPEETKSTTSTDNLDVDTPIHPADTAEHIETLDLDEQVKFIKQLPIKDAASSIAEMEKHIQRMLLEKLNIGLAARIITQMPPDDATDLLSELDEELQRELLTRIPAQYRTELRTLLSFDPDTAGGVMNTDALVLYQDLDVDQAISIIRAQVEDKEIPYYAYLIDGQRHLVGVVSLRELMTARHTLQLKDLVRSQSLVTTHYDVDREEVARLIRHYNFLALPVVDEDNKFLGVVTIDDVIDIIHEEASEDMQIMVGAGVDETTESPWIYSVKKRLPWLIINVLNSAVSAYVVHFFEDNIAKITILAVLMPIVANQAGNTGQQALAVMIRQLATDKYNRKKFWMGVLREIQIGFTNGFFIAIFVFIAVFVLTTNLPLSGVMAAALWFDMLVGSFFGASIPLILKELGRDPAQASTIFLTTITDSVGFFSLLGLAGLFLVGGY